MKARRLPIEVFSIFLSSSRTCSISGFSSIRASAMTVLTNLRASWFSALSSSGMAVSLSFSRLANTA